MHNEIGINLWLDAATLCSIERSCAEYWCYALNRIHMHWQYTFGCECINMKCALRQFSICILQLKWTANEIHTYAICRVYAILMCYCTQSDWFALQQYSMPMAVLHCHTIVEMARMCCFSTEHATDRFTLIKLFAFSFVLSAILATQFITHAFITAIRTFLPFFTIVDGIFFPSVSPSFIPSQMREYWILIRQQQKKIVLKQKVCAWEKFIDYKILIYKVYDRYLLYNSEKPFYCIQMAMFWFTRLTFLLLLF